MSEIYQILTRVQNELKVPKNRYNEFGGFKYRSAEDIEEALKPILLSCGASLVISNDIIPAEGSVYVKSTATLSYEGDSISVSAFAREAFEKKGMDASQSTGCATSYANKYALGNLFLLNDIADSDSMNNSDSPKKEQKELTIEGLKAFCRAKVDSGEDSASVKRFYAYYEGKIDTWKGRFDYEAKWTAWTTPKPRNQ